MQDELLRCHCDNDLGQNAIMLRYTYNVSLPDIQ